MLIHVEKKNKNSAANAVQRLKAYQEGIKKEEERKKNDK